MSPVVMKVRKHNEYNRVLSLIPTTFRRIFFHDHFSCSLFLFWARRFVVRRRRAWHGSGSICIPLFACISLDEGVWLGAFMREGFNSFGYKGGAWMLEEMIMKARLFRWTMGHEQRNVDF